MNNDEIKKKNYKVIFKILNQNIKYKKNKIKI